MPPTAGPTPGQSPIDWVRGFNAPAPSYNSDWTQWTGFQPGFSGNNNASFNSPWGGDMQRPDFPGGSISDKMQFILGQMFLPQYNRGTLSQDAITKSFFEMLQPGAGNAALEKSSEALAGDIFSSGGPIARDIAQARGDITGKGFKTSSADSAERGILTEGVRQVGRTVGQQAGDFEKLREQNIAAGFGGINEMNQNYLNSLFTGFGDIFQLLQGKQAQDIANKGIFGSIFGNLV